MRGVFPSGHDDRANTSGAAASLVVSSEGGVFVSGSAYSAADVYLQLHDAASLPANGTVPLQTVKVAADTTSSLDFLGGCRCGVGIVLACSSTALTLTSAGSALILATYR